MTSMIILDNQSAPAQIVDSPVFGNIKQLGKGLKMAFSRRLLAAVFVLLFSGSIQAQDWGPMNLVYWENAPMAYPGFFNPSYFAEDSILYFDDYFRLVIPETSAIYYSHLDSIIYDNWWWSDPIALPAPINIVGGNNAMAFITASGDSLFFCSDRPGSIGGMDIWLSVKFDDEWTEPVNLGDSINTELNENGPCFASLSGALFFDRNQGEGWQASIYKSEIIGGIWQQAELLPEVINEPGGSSFGGFYDEQEHALHYTDYDQHALINNIMSSYFINNNEWQTPHPLSNNVNGFWYPNYCNGVTTENPFISHDRNLLFYNKWIWEASLCIDFYSYIFVSEAAVGIEEDQIADKLSLHLNIYPNPSNGLFSFAFSKLKNPGTLRIYNITGQLVGEFQLTADDVYLFWNGTDKKNRQVASGVYFAVLENGLDKISEQFVLLK